MKAKERARAAGPLVGGARAGPEARLVDWLAAGAGSRGRAQVRLGGGGAPEGARIFVAASARKPEAVFRKVREGVLAGRAGGGVGEALGGWGTRTDRRGRCGPGPRLTPDVRVLSRRPGAIQGEPVSRIRQ